jgi:hypothetical protein
MTPRQMLVLMCSCVLAFLVLQSVAFAHGKDQEITPVVGRLLSPILPICSGDAEDATLEYEIIYSRPFSHLPGRIHVTFGCGLLKESARMKPARLKPVFVAGEVHELRLRVPDSVPGMAELYPETTRFGAVNVVQRVTPVATQFSVVKGYERGVAARTLERRLLELPCGGRSNEVAVPVRLQIAATGEVSSIEIGSSRDSRVGACVRQNAREWEFPYPSRDRRTGGAQPAEMAFTIVFPVSAEQSRTGGAILKARP